MNRRRFIQGIGAALVALNLALMPVAQEADPYQPHVDALCNDEIEIGECERRCRQTWVDENGPVPDGREFRVGVGDRRLIVGHVEKIHIEPISWKFKSLSGDRNA